MTVGPHLSGFFDEPTNTVSYLIADVDAGQAVVIDQVLGFDAATGAIDTSPADRANFAGNPGQHPGRAFPPG